MPGTATPPQDTAADIVELSPAEDWEADAGSEAPASPPPSGRERSDGGSSGRAPPPGPGQPSRPKVSPKVARLAEDLGFTPEQIAAANDDALLDEIGKVQAWLRGQYQERQRSAAAERAADQHVANRQPAPGVESGTNPAQAPAVDPDLGFDPAEYDPQIVAVLKKFAEKNKALETRLAAYEQKEAAREASGLEARLDAAFAGLGPHFARYVGQGTAAELGKEAREFKARVGVLRATGVPLEKLGGLPPAKLTALVREAAEALYGPPGDKNGDSGAGAYGAGGAAPAAAGTDAIDSPPPAPARGTPPRGPDGRFLTPEERWAQGAVRRPTNRAGGSEPRGLAKAVKAVADAQREMGLTPDVTGDVDESDFPG